MGFINNIRIDNPDRNDFKCIICSRYIPIKEFMLHIYGHILAPHINSNQKLICGFCGRCD